MPSLPLSARLTRAWRPHSAPLPEVSRARRALVALAGAPLLLGVAGCTSGESEPADPASTGESSRAEGRVLPQGVTRSSVRVGHVVGRLPGREQRRVVRDAGRVVDGWFERAWLGDGAARGPATFRGFTPVAERRARGDRRSLTVRGIPGRLGGVVPRTRSVVLDVLAPRGTARAVTARFRLGFAAYDRRLQRLPRRAVVTGRLMLTPVGKQWRVFGYDVVADLPGAGGVKEKTGQKKAGQKKAGQKKAGQKKRPGGSGRKGRRR